MAKDKISQYAFTPAANTDIGGINIDEGCAPSGINNAIRTLMTQIRDLQAGVSGDTIPLTAGGTGSGTAASARAALGLAIGSDVLGYVTPGASGNVLQSDGTNWTSVAQSAAVTLDTITGGPLTVAKGGTNATTAAQARANLNAMQNYTAGATGQVLTSTGTGWISQAAAGGGFTNMTVFASPGTFTTPASTTQIKVTVVGGGGPGLSRQGGGGGGAAIYVGPVTASTSYPITVGAATGTSSFSSLASATGGANTGSGGAGSAGTILITGGGGSGGGVFITNASPASPQTGGITGSGGPSILGGGGRGFNQGNPGSGPVPGNPGNNYGGGGGGAGGSGTVGAGAGGVVIVEY